MFEVLSRPFDTTGFQPLKECGEGWSDPLIWLHATSDLFIWLAFLSIPLLLLYFTRRRDLPFPRLFVLFALFILACGTTHLIEAISMEYPVYRLAGLVKFFTAFVSWVTVIALIPVVPRVMRVVSEAQRPGNETKMHRPLPAARARAQTRAYIIAILAGVLAVLIRAAIDPLMQHDRVFVVPLLAVVYVSWRYGFAPGILCLVIGVVGYANFFVSPRGSIFVTDLGPQLALALFFFCGVACAALGESQRTAQRRATAALMSSVARQEELESEVIRRRLVEAALRDREAELVAAQRQTAEALARLNEFLDNAPMGIAFFDTELRYVRVNPYLAAADGKSVAEYTGRTLPELLPEFPPELAEALRRTTGPDGKPFAAQLRRPDARRPDEARVWQVTAFPVRQPDSVALGAGVIVQDVTDRLKAEEELRRSERNLADFFENANVGLHWVNADGVITRANKAELEMLGYAREEYVGRRIEEFHDDPESIHDILGRLKRGERLDSYPARLRCKDGSTRDVLIAASGLWEDGKFAHSRCFTRDVTELRRATDALRESEQRFRSMADSAPALIWLSELDGRRTYFNRTWLEFTGRTTQQESDFGWTEDIHPDDRQRYLGAYREAFAGRKPLELEYRLRRHDGAYRWVLARGTPRFTPSGDFAGFVGLCLDVTDRREAAEALRASEAFRRSVFENTPDCVKILDLEGRIVEMNGAGLRVFEIDDPAAVNNAPWADLWPVANRETIREAVSAARAGQTGRFQGFCPTMKGTPKYWDVSVAALPGADGSPHRLISVSRDVTEQRRAEDAVRSSELRFRTLTAAVPQMVWTANPRGLVTFFNHRWDEYTGRPLESLAGQEWGGDLLHRDDAAEFRAAWRIAVELRDSPFSHECRLRRADGEYRWMLVAAVSLSDATGAVVEWVGTLTDIDDQKRHAQILEKLVRDRTAELERSNGELEKFAYIASHDLQEPLRKIQAFGDRLRNKCREQLPEPGRDYVDRMLSAAGRMRRLIDDLLSFSRVTTQQRPYARVDLGHLVREVVSDLEVRLSQTNGTVRVGELPVIDADASQMRQLFQNLIVNAVKFHRPGVEPVVEVEGEQVLALGGAPGDGEAIPACRITVRDNGIGFDEKYCDRIFDVFQRLHGRDQYEGTGVGLAICRKIVERHGGTITAQAREGEGASFAITLPVRQHNTREAPVDEVQEEQDDHHPDGRRRPG